MTDAEEMLNDRLKLLDDRVKLLNERMQTEFQHLTKRLDISVELLKGLIIAQGGDAPPVAVSDGGVIGTKRG